MGESYILLLFGKSHCLAKNQVEKIPDTFLLLFEMIIFFNSESISKILSYSNSGNHQFHSLRWMREKIIIFIQITSALYFFFHFF